MSQDLLYYITNHSGSLSIQEVLVNFLMSVVIGFIIFMSYRFSHSRIVYSARFNVSLWMITPVTTMVMCVIGNNIALSLGMVGALSIVRFRTAIKDASDTVYIFWCIAAGVCCGISDFMIAAVGSGIIFILMLMIGGTRDNNRYLLIIRGEEGIGEYVEQCVQGAFHGKEKLCVKNTGRSGVEYIYEISRQLLQAAEDGALITKKLLEKKEVYEVNIISQNDEITS